jgi:hypothetical protein
MKSVNPQAAFFLIPAFWIMWGFGYETVWARFSTEVDGTIISSRDVPSTGAPRYTTEYVVAARTVTIFSIEPARLMRLWSEVFLSVATLPRNGAN